MLYNTDYLPKVSVFYVFFQNNGDYKVVKSLYHIDYRDNNFEKRLYHTDFISKVSLHHGFFYNIGDNKGFTTLITFIEFLSSMFFFNFNFLLDIFFIYI